MKFFSVLVLTLCSSVIIAQDKKTNEDICGVWLTKTGNAKVEIFKKGSSYQGKFVWLVEPINPATGKP